MLNIHMMAEGKMMLKKFPKVTLAVVQMKMMLIERPKVILAVVPWYVGRQDPNLSSLHYFSSYSYFSCTSALLLLLLLLLLLHKCSCNSCSSCLCYCTNIRTNSPTVANTIYTFNIAQSRTYLHDFSPCNIYTYNRSNTLVKHTIMLMSALQHLIVREAPQ